MLTWIKMGLSLSIPRSPDGWPTSQKTDVECGMPSFSTKIPSAWALYFVPFLHLKCIFPSMSSHYMSHSRASETNSKTFDRSHEKMRTMSTTSCLISQEILHAIYTFAKGRETCWIINLYYFYACMYVYWNIISTNTSIYYDIYSTLIASTNGNKHMYIYIHHIIDIYTYNMYVYIYMYTYPDPLQSIRCVPCPLSKCTHNFEISESFRPRQSTGKRLHWCHCQQTLRRVGVSTFPKWRIFVVDANACWCWTCFGWEVGKPCKLFYTLGHKGGNRMSDCG